jgi:hypothetical protein
MNQLKGENMFIFVDEGDRRNLGLDNVPANGSCMGPYDEVLLPSSNWEGLTVVEPDTLQI